MGKKNKVILPPELPPDIADEEIQVSDEDVKFVKENRDYTGFIQTLDTHSITKHVSRVANQNEDAIEALYEKRRKKNETVKKDNGDELDVDPVDALPVKSLDGQLYFRNASKKRDRAVESGGVDKQEEEEKVESVVKLTKQEKRAKLKKSRKEAKRQGKGAVETEVEVEEDVRVNHQAEVLAEVKEDLSAEEVFEQKKIKLAELGMALLADPESNIKSLKEMLQLCKDANQNIVKLALQSLLLVFKDIIPGYRIRLPTEKELEMTVSKVIKKMRFYESTLLSSYKAYLQKLVALEKKSFFKHVTVHCICNLLEAVPHFNFRRNLVVAVVNNISSTDDVIRKLCCTTIKSLFTNEGKHGGEATVEAVHLIADHVKLYDCQLHPDSVEVFLSLSFHEDLGKPQSSEGDDKNKYRGKKGKMNSEDPKKGKASTKKRSRKDLLEQTRQEVDADLRATSFTPDVLEQCSMQSETLTAVFQTFFRILKHAMRPTAHSSTMDNAQIVGRFGTHPLLAPCLNGLGKFSHLIDLDFMSDLMKCLKVLASGGSKADGSSESFLTVSERLRCCIVAFKVMRSNLDALNVDLQEFFVQLYNLLLEYRPDRDQGDVLAEALKIMLCEGRQHDMQRAAAFVKRLATSSLFFGSAEAMAALVTLRELLQKNAKCRNLLENDAGGGSLSGSVAIYQPCASDPNQSGALASVLWELSLLCKHYHPTISTAASSILTINTANQVYLATTSPQQAFVDLSIHRESFNPKRNSGTQSRKRKGGGLSSKLSANEPTLYSGDEKDLRKRLSEHFTVLRDIAENERLRRELKHTVSSIRLYEEYKKQKKNPRDSKEHKSRKKVKKTG